ncbi:Cysteine-rich secretory protein family protein [compost metagenome]
MKSNLLGALSLIVIAYTLDSCSSDNVEPQDTNVVMNYTYVSSELETLELINIYRLSIGLNALEKINHISYKSEEHDNYMIANNVVNHHGFVERSENIKNVLGAKTVSEIIAYNYNSPEAAFTAWMNSPKHRETITGDYTHFGISIRENPDNKRKYYTNIFIKI